MEMKKINYMLEIAILMNSSQKCLGVLLRHPDALLAKTMLLGLGGVSVQSLLDILLP